MDTTTIVYITAEVIVGVCSIVGNSIVLAAIIKTQRLHTVTNVFVGNLALADIVVGFLVAPCAALSYLGLPHNLYGCILVNSLILIFTNISILMLVAVAIERFIAIKSPFVYQRILTVRRAIYINILVWILGSILGLMPMYGWNTGKEVTGRCSFLDVITYEYMVYFQFFGLVLIPMFLMLCIYAYILVIVRRHMRQTNALHSRFQAENRQSNDGFKKDVRAAKMFAVVILLFGIFWFPVNIFNCVSLFCGSKCDFPYESLLTAIVMSHANSSLNPFIYAASNSRIKRAIKTILGIKLSQQDLTSSTEHFGGGRSVTNGVEQANGVLNSVDRNVMQTVTEPTYSTVSWANVKATSTDLEMQPRNGQANHGSEVDRTPTPYGHSFNDNHSSENENNVFVIRTQTDSVKYSGVTETRTDDPEVYSPSQYDIQELQIQNTGSLTKKENLILSHSRATVDSNTTQYSFNPAPLASVLGGYINKAFENDDDDDFDKTVQITTQNQYLPGREHIQDVPDTLTHERVPDGDEKNFLPAHQIHTEVQAPTTPPEETLRASQSGHKRQSSSQDVHIERGTNPRSNKSTKREQKNIFMELDSNDNQGFTQIKHERLFLDKNTNNSKSSLRSRSSIGTDSCASEDDDDDEEEEEEGKSNSVGKVDSVESKMLRKHCSWLDADAVAVASQGKTVRFSEAGFINSKSEITKL